MIKKLDTLIIRAFVGPFFATFLIALFVLVMQFFWLYIDDLVGKGLDIFTIFKLIGYVAAFNVPMALPLALLLSSIMTFGNLGESFELVAIKSAGIPLVRFMRPLLLVTIGISGIAFLFSNNVIPVVNLKLNALKYDIIVTKPAFDIKEGTFYDKIDGFVIKIGKKEKDDSTIRNVVIYEKAYNLQDRMLVAESGIMRTTPDKRFLEFNLRNGWRYEENGPRNSLGTDFIRLGFKEYKKVMDLSSFKQSKTEDSLFKYDAKMLSVRQLTISIDSLEKGFKTFYERARRETAAYLTFARFGDSNWAKVKVPPPVKAKNFDALIADSIREQVDERAISQISMVSTNITQISNDYVAKRQILRKHWIEWNRKFTLSAGCIVLFMIGAPLGSIIRKGGLGMPLVFAIIFFVVFYILNTMGEKFAKEGVTSIGVGMWLSTMVLVPIGLFLTTKAMSDSQLFNKEAYFRFFKKVRKLIKRSKEEDTKEKTAAL
ncbi:lipopolysaccharide export system permease protein [Filimonas zeae]|uniref:Membrane protein n=1 Tax=Filimonas zeae TaxID=1737353 RepID=A0A917MYJ1_9BACT|nr:LptF/LptG family permease [Filimonas zeae]MDR6341910.1 lipopolysaccharide export system permease protein [Filimonas zeae]GGH79860.1 membrane protein [Filimonas zeae]